MNVLKIRHNGSSENERGLNATPALAARGEARPAGPSFFLKVSRSGQQIIEYGLLISALSMAFLAMYMYTKRGLQSTIKDLTDYHLGPQIDSAPVLAGGSHQDTQAVTYTRTQDQIRVRKDPVAGAQYDFSSASYTTGSSTGVFNDV